MGGSDANMGGSNDISPLGRPSLAAKKSALKMAAAAAFMGEKGAGNPPLRLNMRHIVTLKPGAIVGEIALFRSDKRISTVRTSEPTEILKLDRATFLNLDQATLNIISENARYNAACTKEPSERTHEDLQMLRQRLSTFQNLSNLSQEVQLELCKVMYYRSVNENTLIVRKNTPAECLYILVTGTCASIPSNHGKPLDCGRGRE